MQAVTTFVVLSLVSLASGVWLALTARQMPSRSAALERWGGVLLVAGLALLGVALQRVGVSR